MAIPKKKTQDKTKATNEGDMAEGVLGAAIVAKLVERKPNGQIGKIHAVQVLKILRMMQKVPFTKHGISKAQVKVDMGGMTKDRIVFFLNLGMKMMEELQTIDLKLLTRLAEAASSYVNTPRIESLAKVMYNNNINNKLEIDVDGISANTTTKSDIVVKTDKFVFDKISLKAGKMSTGHSLGQVGGNSWSACLRLFYEGVNERTKRKDIGMLLPINTSTNENQYMKLVTSKPTFVTVEKAVRFAYQKAQEAFNRTAQTMLVTNLYKFLQHHTSRGDSDIKIVMLHLSTHKTLNPLLLEQALKNTTLRAVVREDTKWPIFLVYDTRVSKEVPSTKYAHNVLFALRPRIDARTEGYITHLVEGGPRFDELIEEK